MSEIIKKCKKILQEQYGPQFQGLILYGSAARGHDDPSSDIDLLVLIKKPFNYFQELRRITDMLYPLQLDCDQLISAKPAAIDEYEHGTIQLYRNAKQEGCML